MFEKLKEFAAGIHAGAAVRHGVEPPIGARQPRRPARPREPARAVETGSPAPAVSTGQPARETSARPAGGVSSRARGDAPAFASTASPRRRAPQR